MGKRVQKRQPPKTPVSSSSEDNPKASAAKAKPGCNVPFLKNGCILGVDIPAGAAKPPSGAVRMRCRNAECPAVPWIHAECYEDLVERLSDECLRTHNRCTNWSKKFAMDNLWRQGRGYDLIYNLTKCPAGGCNGFLRRDDDFDPVAASEPKQQKVKPAKAESSKKAAQTASASGGESSGQPMTKAQMKKMRPDVTKLLKSHGHSTLLSQASGKSKGKGRQRDDEEEDDASPYLLQNRREPRPLKAAFNWAPAKSVEDDAAPPKAEKAPAWAIVPPPPPPPPSSFPQLPAAPPVPAAKTMEEAPATGTGAWGGPVRKSAEGRAFVDSLDSLVKASGGSLWESSAEVTQLFAGCSVRLMEEVSSAGGLGDWLRLCDAPLALHKGCLVSRGAGGAQLKSTGIVEKRSPGGTAFLIHCEAYETRLLFDEGSLLRDATGRDLHLRLLHGDWISFVAEQAPEGSAAKSLGLSWFIREAELLQRGSSEPTAQEDTEELADENDDIEDDEEDDLLSVDVPILCPPSGPSFGSLSPEPNFQEHGVFSLFPPLAPGELVDSLKPFAVLEEPPAALLEEPPSEPPTFRAHLLRQLSSRAAAEAKAKAAPPSFEPLSSLREADVGAERAPQERSRPIQARFARAPPPAAATVVVEKRRSMGRGLSAAASTTSKWAVGASRPSVSGLGVHAATSFPGLCPPARPKHPAPIGPPIRSSGDGDFSLDQHMKDSII